MRSRRRGLLALGAALLCACGTGLPPTGGPVPPAPEGRHLLCAPTAGAVDLVTVMDAVNNESDRPIRVVGASLVDSVNLTVVDVRAWPAGQFLAVFPLADVQEGNVPSTDGADHAWQQSSPLAGHTIEGGDSAGIAVVLHVDDPSRPAAWSTVRILYEADGRTYRYDSTQQQLLIPGPTCDAIPDIGAAIDELLDR